MIRNTNNPGNIRNNPYGAWKGQNGAVRGFCKFESLSYGIRALILLLKRYRTTHGLKTIKTIITRYAPPIENDTDSYIKTVSREISRYPTDILSPADYPALIKSIILVEQGRTYLDRNLEKINAAIDEYINLMEE